MNGRLKLKQTNKKTSKQSFYFPLVRPIRTCSLMLTIVYYSPKILSNTMPLYS